MQFNYPPEHLLHPGLDGMDREVAVDLGTGSLSVMKESELMRLSGQSENDDEIVHWVQYHLPADGRMVHRSVHVHLKKASSPVMGATAVFG